MALKNRHVKMTRVGNNRWDLIGPKGNIIVGDMLLYTRNEATEWVKNYISSYMGWTYEIVVKYEN